MTRLGEIRHVLIKDVNETHRMLALYLAIVVVATAHSAGVSVFGLDTFGMSMVFVAIVGALLAASVVQADSPTRVDAFWATHPFRRSSMLGAKIAFALLIVLIAALGQTIGVYSFGLREAASVWPVLGPTLLFSAALLGVMLMASITRDLRSFIVAVIAILIVVLFTAAILDRKIRWMRDVRLPIQILGLIAAAVLLLWLYLTRDNRRRTSATAWAVVALTMMSTCSSESTEPVTEREVVNPHPPAITLEPGDPRFGQERGLLSLAVRVTGMTEGMRAQIELPFVDISLRDGSVLHVPLENPYLDFGATWPMSLAEPPIPGIRWIGGIPQRTGASQLVPRLSGPQRRAIAAGIAGIVIDGRVRLWESRADETMPVAVGSTITANGHRTRIIEWTPQDERSTVLIASTAIDTDGQSGPFGMMFGGRQEFALVNEARREAAPLLHEGMSGRFDGLVLPGLTLQSERAHFGLRFGGGPDSAIPDSVWLSGARLMRVTSRLVGSYAIRLQSKEWPSEVSATRIPASAVPTRDQSVGPMIMYR